MLPWREVCQEQPTEDLALNLRIAGRTLRMKALALAGEIAKLFK